MTRLPDGKRNPTTAPVRTRIEGAEVKALHGVRIERDVPVPAYRRRGVLYDLLAALEVTESFVWHVRVQTRDIVRKDMPGRVFHCKLRAGDDAPKQGEGRYRIWRMK